MTKSEIKKFIVTLFDLDPKSTELLSFEFTDAEKLKITLEDSTGIFVYTIGVLEVNRVI